jgi:alpha-L-rhamnosidase
VLGTAYFARSAALVGKMAAAVGRTEDAKKCSELAEGIRAAFRKAFVSEDGKVAGDSQGAYALALDFDLLDGPSRKAAFDRLAKNVEEVYGGHLSTGFASTLPALVELSKGGRHDLAAKLVLDKTFPSWGYEIENGATTLWERWDGFVKDRGFQDPGMNSFDHYAFGAVGEWMMRMLAGIELDPAHPGWSRFTIHPRPCAGVSSLHAERASIRGRIVSGWTLSDGAFELEVAIPANTSATVVLPARDASKLEEGGHPIVDSAPHVKVLSVKDGEATLDVAAGRYKFRSQP